MCTNYEEMDMQIYVSTQSFLLELSNISRRGLLAPPPLPQGRSETSTKEESTNSLLRLLRMLNLFTLARGDQEKLTPSYRRLDALEWRDVPDEVLGEADVPLDGDRHAVVPVVDHVSCRVAV